MGKDYDDEERDIQISVKTNKMGKLIICLLIALVIIGGLLYYIFGVNSTEAKYVSKSNLKRIVSVSELSTYKYVYNGIARKYSDKKKKELSYCVYYEGNVKAGLDAKKIEIKSKRIAKIVKVILPEITITNYKVKPDSVKAMYMETFHKRKSHAKLYKVAKNDLEIKTKGKEEKEIKKAARKNAEKIIKSLIEPLVKQYDYKVVFK